LEAAASQAASLAEPGDMVLSLGAGDVNQICTLVAQKLNNRKLIG
jgi:UDP-N-acetylmuramate--alanine ligase